MPTLDWLDRERALRRADEVPYRLLDHVSSHGDPSAGNLLIQGDNLEALNALLPFYRGRVKQDENGRDVRGQLDAIVG